MSYAHTHRVEDKLLKRGWQLSKAYYDHPERGPVYILQLANVIRAGDRAEPWALRVMVPEQDVKRATVGEARYWEYLYDKLVKDAERGMLATQQKLIEAAETAEDDAANQREPAGSDAERIARYDQGPRPDGLVRPDRRILDAGGNPLS